MPTDVDSAITSLSVHRMPLASFVRILSDRFDIGIVCSEDVNEKQVTGEFKNSSLKSILNVVSRQVKVDVIRDGNTYYIGSLRPEDRGVLFRKCYGLAKDEILRMLQSSISVQGKCEVAENGIIVVTDHESVLRRCVELLDYLEIAESPTWILQLYFVSLRKDAIIDAGLATKSSGMISYDIAENRFSVDEAKIEALFTFDASSQFADVYATPMMLIRDGTEAVWTDGETVPIVKKTVSDYGTVSTSGYDYKDVGFTVKGRAVETRQRKVNLRLDIEMSEIKGYTETAPNIVQTAFHQDVDLRPNKIYLLGELSKFTDVTGQNQILNFGASTGKINLQVWGKIYRLSSDIKRPYPTHQPKRLYDRWRLAPFEAVPALDGARQIWQDLTVSDSARVKWSRGVFEANLCSF